MEKKNRKLQLLIGSGLCLALILSAGFASIAQKNRNPEVKEEPAGERVADWEAFTEALQDETVEKIVLEKNLTAGNQDNEEESEVLVSRDLVIDGQGYTIESEEAVVLLDSVEEETELRIENLTYEGGGTEAVIQPETGKGGKWSVTLSDVRTEGESGRSLIDLPDGKVTLESLDIQTSGEETLIQADELLVAEGGKVSIIGTPQARAASSPIVSTTTYELGAGAEMEIQTSASGSYAMRLGADLYLYERSSLRLTGSGKAPSLIYFTPSSGCSMTVESEAELYLEHNGTEGNISGLTYETYANGVFGGLTNATFYGGSKTSLNTHAVGIKMVAGGLLRITNEEMRNKTSTGNKMKATSFDAYSERSVCISVCDGTSAAENVSGTRKTAKVLIEGEGTEINLEGKQKSSETGGSGSIVLGGPSSSLTVTDYAQVNIETGENTTMKHSGIYMTGRNAGVEVSNYGVVNIDHEIGNSTTGAGIQFASYANDVDVGGMYLKVSGGGKLNVEAYDPTGGYANVGPAIYMSGTNNNITAESGGQIYAVNRGGTTKNSSASLNNAAIAYGTTSTTGTNTFTVTGKDSEVALEAAMGPAVSMGRPGTITLTDQASFSAKGNVESSGGVFYGTSTLKVTIDNPLYFDFQNTDKESSASSKGHLFRCTSGTSTSFLLTKSNLALWEKKDDIEDISTYRMKDMEEVRAGGTNMGTSYSSIPEWDKLSYFTEYARISANNAVGQVYKVWKPTDADKQIYVYARVPEGARGEYREAWEEEIGVRLKITSPDGQVVYKEGKTKGHSPGVEVYGAEAAGGIVVIENGGRYLEPGTEIEIDYSWYGEAETYAEAVEDEEALEQNPECSGVEGVLAGKWEVQKLELVSGISSGDMEYGKGTYESGTFKKYGDIPIPLIHEETEKISGKITDSSLVEEIKEKGLKLAVYIDDEEKAGIKSTLKEDGSWEVDVSEITLEEGQELAVSLRYEAETAKAEKLEPEDFKRLSEEKEYQAYLESKGESDQLEKWQNQAFIRNSGYESPDVKWEKGQTDYSQETVFHDKEFTARLKLYVIETPELPTFTETVENKTGKQAVQESREAETGGPSYVLDLIGYGIRVENPEEGDDWKDLEVRIIFGETLDYEEDSLKFATDGIPIAGKTEYKKDQKQIVYKAEDVERDQNVTMRFEGVIAREGAPEKASYIKVELLGREEAGGELSLLESRKINPPDELGETGEDNGDVRFREPEPKISLKAENETGKQADRETTKVGDEIQYTYELSNEGGAASRWEDIEISAGSLPEGMELVKGSITYQKPGEAEAKALSDGVYDESEKKITLEKTHIYGEEEGQDNTHVIVFRTELTGDAMGKKKEELAVAGKAEGWYREYGYDSGGKVHQNIRREKNLEATALIEELKENEVGPFGEINLIIPEELDYGEIEIQSRRQYLKVDWSGADESSYDQMVAVEDTRDAAVPDWELRVKLSEEVGDGTGNNWLNKVLRFYKDGEEKILDNDEIIVASYGDYPANTAGLSWISQDWYQGGEPEGLYMVLEKGQGTVNTLDPEDGKRRNRYKGAVEWILSYTP